MKEWCHCCSSAYPWECSSVCSTLGEVLCPWLIGVVEITGKAEEWGNNKIMMRNKKGGGKGGCP